VISATISSVEAGFSLSGDIRFDNVLTLRRDGNRLIRQCAGTALQVDLSGITSSDTSGLSLFLRWLRYADMHNKKIRYTSIPEPLLKVAKVCGVVQLIGE